MSANIMRNFENRGKGWAWDVAVDKATGRQQTGGELTTLTLPDQDYRDILAYIFSRCRFPPANEPLVMSDRAALVIEKP